MKASELMRALMEQAERTELTYGTLVDLWEALPLIADVVEAAEAEVANAQLVCDEEILLDRALTALRDALEGGDE